MRALRLGWALAFLATGAAAQEPWRQEMVWRLRSDQRLPNLYAACPADVAGRRASHPVASGKPSCDADPVACLAQCLGGAGEACFDLGLLTETAQPPLPAPYWKSLYAAACELGEPGGCTNRAASLRNFDSDDALDHVAEPAAACEYRAFRYACDREDAWGCAMLGQALMNGEGADVNPEGAKRAFAEACAIDPKFEACDFAHKREDESRLAARP